MRVIKFLITGAIGISVNLGVFHILYVLGVPYLVGSVIGLAVSMVVGFVLQKYWTFEERSTGHTHRQFALYAGLAIANLGVNTLIVYLLVEYGNVFYLLAQAIGAAIIAIDSFFAYHLYIFRPKNVSSVIMGE